MASMITRVDGNLSLNSLGMYVSMRARDGQILISLKV